MLNAEEPFQSESKDRQDCQNGETVDEVTPTNQNPDRVPYTNFPLARRATLPWPVALECDTGHLPVILYTLRRRFGRNSYIQRIVDGLFPMLAPSEKGKAGSRCGADFVAARRIVQKGSLQA